jgi:hypothetical protein
MVGVGPPLSASGPSGSDVATMNFAKPQTGVHISHAPETRTEFESGRIVAPDDGPSWVLLALIALLARTAAKGGVDRGTFLATRQRTRY